VAAGHMARTDAPYRIVYNSDLMISNQRELSTLCVFYDQVLLPYTTPHGSRALASTGSPHIPYPPAFYEDLLEAGIDRNVAKWEERNSLLFSEGVLARLPEARNRADLMQVLRGMRPHREEFIELFLSTNFTLSTSDRTDAVLPLDLAIHLLRADILAPQIFVSRSLLPPGEVLKTFQAKATFAYLLPELTDLRPEDILEIRREVRDTREGFSMHLQKLSKELDERVSAGEAPAEVERLATRLVETELIPDYREFRRQLASRGAGAGAKLLGALERILEIDAAPWTPKFYGQLLRAVGLSAVGVEEERRARFSNRSQAFQFMGRVEDWRARELGV
jgi:hypothetical protein